MKKLILTTVAIFALVGCGGGGGSGSVTDKLSINTNADKIAYKSADGDWQTIDTSSGSDWGNGLKHYEIDKLDKYIIALKCPTPAVMVGAFTKDDGDVTAKCNQASIIPLYTVKGTLTDSTASVTTFVNAISNAYGVDTSSPFKYNFNFIKKGIYDFLALSIKTSGPYRFYIERDVNINSNTIKNVDLTSSNSCLVGSKNFNASTFRHVLITKGNTYFTTSYGGNWYYPKCDLDNDDIFALVGKSSANKTVRLETYPAKDFKSDIPSKNISHIKKLTQVVYQATGQLSGLSLYTPDSQSPNLVAYGASFAKGINSYSLLVSKNYLGSSDVFDFPNLSGVSGFSGVWNGDNATAQNISVYMSDHKIGELLGGKHIKLSEIQFYMPKKAILEVANQ